MEKCKAGKLCIPFMNIGLPLYTEADIPEFCFLMVIADLRNCFIIYNCFILDGEYPELVSNLCDYCEIKNKNYSTRINVCKCD